VNVPKVKAYMVKCPSYSKWPDIVNGAIISESGTRMGFHTSSNDDWLRSDLRKKVSEHLYEVVDLINQDIPKELQERLYIRESQENPGTYVRSR